MKVKPELSDAPDATIATISTLADAVGKPDDLVSLCRSKLYPLLQVYYGHTHIRIWPGGILPGSVYVDIDPTPAERKHE